jgi:beta-lactamase regulating signal transducer with metallopeptidase domain
VSTHLFLESALRSIIMGVTILAALRLLRIRQARAQRAAWLLALIAALAMPALVARQVGPRLLPPVPALGLLQRGPSLSARLPAVHYNAAANLEEAPIVIEFEPHSRPVSLAAAVSYAGAGLYFAVAGLLLLRLCLGVGFALRLRNRAQRIACRLAARADIRVSAGIATPVTVASTVLLPPTYLSWDEPTLLVVLTHERAHVRQKDFYVQLLAGFHCALFWFSPFSWWLQRQLSELGEALSDGAAVEQAQSRVTYAEVLLAFAARARSGGSHWPLAGVAMARARGLSSRIERLLSDRGFEQCFAGKQRLVFVAAGVVLLALMASTTTTKVRAAAPEAFAAAPEAVAAAPEAVAAPERPAAPETTIAATGEVSHTGASTARAPNDSILAIRAGDSKLKFDWEDKLPAISGDYIYYRHDGKSYVVQDPQTLARAQTLLAPLKELAQQQKELGKQQAVLGRQQKILGAQQLRVKVDTPEFKRAMADLDTEIKKMDLAHLAPQIDQKALAELQSHLSEMTARVAAEEAELGAKLGKLGEQQGVLGEQQGEIGEEQGRLSEEQRKIIEDAKTQLKPMIEHAIRDGMATVQPML